MDESRVILHFDLDCFYAQVEEMKRPLETRNRPLGVTQKFLVVTTNYAARSAGVPKMASISQAKQICPEIILVNGEDLTPYREASRKVMDVLRRYGTFEKRGLDEAVVDVSHEVNQRQKQQCNIPLQFSGNVFCPKYSPDTSMSCVEDSSAVEGQLSPFLSSIPGKLDANEERLKIGSTIASEIRLHLKTETGYTCSCGISFNKMFAKMASGLHKPNGQTVVLPRHGYLFISEVSVKQLPGVGDKLSASLKSMAIETVCQLREVPADQLNRKFGDRIGQFLFDICRGIDDTPVKDKGPPKSVSVEDSFRNCTTLKQAEAILSSLAPDFISRLEEEYADSGRSPATFVLKWRTRAGGWSFQSSSTKMPMEIISADAELQMRVSVVVKTALNLLGKKFTNSDMDIVVLNIGASNFVKSENRQPCMSSIRHFLPATSGQPQTVQLTVGKRQARMIRESTLTHGTSFQHPTTVKAPETLSEANSQGSDEGGDDEVIKRTRFNVSMTDAARCKLCGAVISPLEKDAQEHNDFHLAEEIQRSFCGSGDVRGRQGVGVQSQQRKKGGDRHQLRRIDEFLQRIGKQDRK